MMKKLQKCKLTTGYVRMWPRKIFYIRKQNKLFVKKLSYLEQSGVYVLYRKEQPYYVGKAEKLAARLHDHANKSTDRYYLFWDYFSAFFAPRNLCGELEAILIAAMPTANGSKPRLREETLPGDFRRILRDEQVIEIAPEEQQT
jgi:hypothetical protein